MTNRIPLLTSLLAGLLLTAGLGCRKVETTPAEVQQGKTAASLLKEGEAALKTKQWEDGRKSLKMIEDYFPSSPEFPKAKIMLADSYFFANTASYQEALVEYQSFLNYFPQHEQREYALYRAAMCHFASIENAERDQAETRLALEAFKALIQEAPGSMYVVDAREKITQCWRRLAESDLMVGIFYVNGMSYPAAERRLKGVLESYPEYVDRERAYYYLGEAMRRRGIDRETLDGFHKDFLSRNSIDTDATFTAKQLEAYKTELKAMEADLIGKYRKEAQGYYQKLVESYPGSPWAGRAKDRLLEMGQTRVKEELDS